MNKKILLTLMVVLAVALSAGTIYASDVNVTDSPTSIAQDDTAPVSVDSESPEVVESDVDNDMSNDVLESDNSSILSTNSEDGDTLASDNNASSEIDVSKTVTAKDVTKYYKGSTKYTATYLDSYGNPLNNTKVKITVNGVTYTKTTDSNGKASLSINLKPGTYKVTTTNPSTGYKKTTTFKVLTTIKANDISKVYKDGRKFSATFLNSNGKPLANKYIKFKIKGKTYKKKTNSKGVASLSLTTLKKGTYKIISYNTDGLTKTNTVKVVKTTTTKLTASKYTFLKSESKTIKVKLLNKFGYAPSKGKVIKFTVNGKTYSAKTDSKGFAKLKLPSLKEGIYTVKYKFAAKNPYKGSSTTSKVTILPSKTPTYTVKSTKTFGYGAKTPFKLALKSGSVPLIGYSVKLNVHGVNYTKTTDSNGMVSLPIGLAIGKYTITYTNKATSKINSKTASCNITVKQRTATTLKWESSTSFNQGTPAVKVLLLDSKKNPIAGQTVKLTVNSKTYSAKSSSSGYATFNAYFAPGDYKVSCSYDGDNDNAPKTTNTAVSVNKVTQFSVSSIVSAASSLKSYYENNKKFPSTVSVKGIPVTVPELVYMMCKAIDRIDKSNKNDIAIMDGVSAPSSPSGDDINSRDLSKSGYLAVADKLAGYIYNNKKAPNYVSSSVGKIIYTEVVDSLTRILSFYKNEDRLPNYVMISYSSGSSSSQSGNGLNEKNTIKDLTAYLKASKNCQVDNSKIKALVDKLTKGLTSDSAKANAIFKYVRDTLSYSFYYNTKYGAVGTLNAGHGNCVDHSHLLTAMFRTANLATRYVHGTCKFSSGSTYGHVWTQVLINGKWTVADATSSKNSLGSVSNWNTKSYTLHGMYSSLSF